VRLLAIEITEHELRVARGERSFGLVRVHGLDRIPLDGSPESLRHALADLAVHRPGAVLSVLPAAASTHRVLTLPFRDRSRLARTAPLELLGQLPLTPDEAVVAVRPLARVPGGTMVLAAAVRRTDLDAHLSLLAEAGLRSSRVDLAPLPALDLVPDHAGPVALVVADGTRSAVVVRRDGRLTALRALGGDAGDPELLAIEARWALEALGFAGRVLVAGSGAAGVQPVLAATLQTPVDHCEPPATVAAAGEPADVAACTVPAGLLVGEGRRARSGLVLAGEGDEPAGSWRRTGTLAAAALVLALVDVALVRASLVRRDDALAKAAVAVAAAAMPGTPVTAARAQLEEAVAARRRLRPAGDVPVLEMLREVSARVPDSLRLDLDELVVEPDVVRLHGRCESFDAVESLRKALAASPLVRDVQTDETRTTVDGTGVEFRLRVLRRDAVGAPS
jgi:hypothetical protein